MTRGQRLKKRLHKAATDKPSDKKIEREQGGQIKYNCSKTLNRE